MNWLPLRNYNVPIIDKQIDRAVQIFNQIRQSIMEGDILAVQRMAELQLSIKKRVSEIDDFYNKNCLDQRVRYLQGAKMKLVRLICLPPATNYEKEHANTPWKLAGYSSRQSERSRSKSATPRKKMGKNTGKTLNDRSKTSRPQNQNQTADRLPYEQQNTQRISPIGSKKQPQNYILQSNKPKQSNIPGQNIKPIKTTRKTELVPAKVQSKSTLLQPSQTIERGTMGGFKQSTTSPTPKSQIKSKSSKASEQNSSLKKLNDLIFTIKMTKQQYNSFIQVKKQMTQGPVSHSSHSFRK